MFGEKECLAVAETIPRWKETHEVESFDVDVNSRLLPHVLFAFLLNCAWNHAKRTGIGYEALGQGNMMWVLSKMQIAVRRMPVWGEIVAVETWGKRPERLYALRDFTMTTPEGEKLCSATSAWLILDRKTRRPQRLETWMSEFPWMPERSEMETDTKKVGEVRSVNPCREVGVVYSDLDVNRHVNATRYLKWIIDSYPIEQLTARSLRHVDMSFLLEGAQNDTIQVCMECRPKEDRCAVRRASNGQDFCRARIEWQNSGSR
jgi:medium-chain acyl-[acyl-carrier-protein] hydrolase